MVIFVKSVPRKIHQSFMATNTLLDEPAKFSCSVMAYVVVCVSGNVVLAKLEQ